jgi:pimeloyl-ACP methyl ester carboxylesterase
MERMLRAGYGTFAWDKPGTGESTGQIDRSRLREQRAQIVLDAIAVLKDRSDIDHRQIGMWGISQAGYVMPSVLSKTDDIAFMIAVSCPGVAGVDQGAYLVSEQAKCAGLADKDAEQLEVLLAEIERVQTYEEYVDLKEQIDSFPLTAAARGFGLTRGVKPREEWHAGNLEGEYFWNPMQIIEETTIPVLAFFGTKDTQVDPYQGADAYRAALERAGNPNFHIKLIPDGDHNLILSETGCLDERRNRSASGWRNYPPEYLDTLEEWLQMLKQ